MTRPPPRFEIDEPDDGRPWMVWGGHCPSGSLKYFTFAEYFEREPVEHAAGLIEMTGGCTALALEHFAGDHGIPVTAVCDSAGAEYLGAHDFGGEILVPSSVEEAFSVCENRVADGWHWPRQMVNPTMIDCVEAWATALRDQLPSLSEIRTVVTGFGTGATAIGLHRVFDAAGCAVVAVQCAPENPIPGWRNYELQNMGEHDLFRDYEDAIKLITLPADAPSRPLDALLSHDYESEPAGVLLISHDARRR
jgi:cysteine synthase B